MSMQQPEEGEQRTRYHDVNSAETRSAYRRNMYLMLAAAVGIAFSFAIPRMCPAGPAVDASAEELQRNLTEAFGDYVFDVKSSTGQDGQFRCTIYVIASQGAAGPKEHIEAFEKAAYSAYGEQDGEVVWRFYRQTPATASDDPAFIGLHKSDLRKLAQRLGTGGERN